MTASTAVLIVLLLALGAGAGLLIRDSLRDRDSGL